LILDLGKTYEVNTLSPGLGLSWTCKTLVLPWYYLGTTLVYLGPTFAPVVLPWYYLGLPWSYLCTSGTTLVLPWYQWDHPQLVVLPGSKLGTTGAASPLDNWQIPPLCDF